MPSSYIKGDRIKLLRDTLELTDGSTVDMTTVGGGGSSPAPEEIVATGGTINLTDTQQFVTFTGAAGQTVVLPDATTLTNGTSVKIVNRCDLYNFLTIQNSALATILQIASNHVAELTVFSSIDNDWTFQDYPILNTSGSLAPDANLDMVGYNVVGVFELRSYLDSNLTVKGESSSGTAGVFIQGTSGGLPNGGLLITHNNIEASSNISFPAGQNLVLSSGKITSTDFPSNRIQWGSSGQLIVDADDTITLNSNGTGTNINLFPGTGAKVNVGNSLIINVADPVSPQDAATMAYTDTKVPLSSGAALMPSFTTTERDAIATPANGMVIYNTTLNKFQGRENGAWVTFTTI